MLISTVKDLLMLLMFPRAIYKISSLSHHHKHLLSVYVFLSEYMPCDCSWPQMPEEGVELPRAGVTGGCELPTVGAGNRTWILHKSSICS